jgi:hypothetical protein
MAILKKAAISGSGDIDEIEAAAKMINNVLAFFELLRPVGPVVNNLLGIIESQDLGYAEL